MSFVPRTAGEIAALIRDHPLAWVASRDLDATLGGLSVAVKHFDQAADNLDRMMRDSRKPVSDFTTRGLPELQQLLADSRVLVAELTRLVDSLDRDPSRVIYGNRLQGYTPQ